MAVYHFTIHAYRSWRPDHPRGYVHHTDGLLSPDPEMAKWYDAHSKFKKVPFEEGIQRILIRGTRDICSRRDWRFHAAGTDPTHLHLSVSWKDFVSCQDVLTKLKTILGYILAKEIGPVGRKWFGRGGSKRRVTKRSHFDFLVTEYFPDHSGVFWKEGEPLP